MTAKKARSYKINLKDNKSAFTKIISKLSAAKDLSYDQVLKIMQKNPGKTGPLSKSKVLLAYKELKDLQALELSPIKEKNFLKNIRMKKVRTISGVTPVTVLTKPFPCPGKCIFCPNDVRMPKSYLSDEPGAQRAEANNFDPYFQTFNRLQALKNIGHPTDKVELIILGGTWSHYPEDYQIWFVKRCLDALNDFESSQGSKMLEVTAKPPIDTALLEEIHGESMKTSYNKTIAKALTTKLAQAQKETATWEQLFATHKRNETAKARCIGLVVETRPDEITKEEVTRMRKLGATKVQIGIQSLDDKVLKLNKRGHNVAQTKKAVNMLRHAGFKIHAHWMPNLYGSTPAKDIKDFRKLFSDPAIMPDELKVYPCSLIESAELMKFYKDGQWKPYSDAQLLKVLTEVFKNTPRYCRLTRVIRDIPSTDIVAGNKKTNFRQIAEREVQKQGAASKDIRAREVRGAKIGLNDLTENVTTYETAVSVEHFIEYITDDDKLAGFLRLSLPKASSFLRELGKNAIIREVHVYGQSVELGAKKEGKAQHIGLGKKLMKKAEQISKDSGHKKISVISSIGTRQYYENNGFAKVAFGELYQTKTL